MSDQADWYYSNFLSVARPYHGPESPSYSDIHCFAMGVANMGVYASILSKRLEKNAVYFRLESRLCKAI
jgi:hypothetical protein